MDEPRDEEALDNEAAHQNEAAEDEPPSAEDVGLEEVAAEPASEEEPPPEGEQRLLRSDAPGVPWAIDLRSTVTHYTPTPDGGMIIQFTAAVPTPQGAMLMPPAVLVRFKQAGWEAFQREVAAGGVKAPVVQTAQTLPPSRIVRPGR